ncbi:MAG: META domain-containing protein, partial [Propionicimonas sp.]
TPAVPDPSVGTLNFLAGGQAAGSTGCNRFSGAYAQSGEDLTITTELMTAAACIGSAGEQDTAVIAALEKVATAGVAADQLVL